MKTTTLALAISLLPFSAQAQANPAFNDMVYGAVACAIGFGDLAALDSSLTSEGWVKGDTVDGLIEYQAPNGSEETYTLVGEGTGEVCNVWSASLGIEDAKAVAQSVLEKLSVKMDTVKIVKDEFGCDALELPSGILISAVSSEDPPLCEGGTGSQLIFAK